MTKLARLMTWHRQCLKVFPYGSSIMPYLGTLVLLQVPVIGFLYDINTSHSEPVVFSIFCIVLDIMTVVFMSVCTFRDPGIIPQSVSKYELQNDLIGLPQSIRKYRQQHVYLIVSHYGISFPQKYCVQCCIYRPMRAIHCRICNHCVERYDHHCPWLGVCIGKYNYIYFFVFLTFICLLSVFTFISFTDNQKFTRYWLQLFLSLFCCGFGAPLLKLWTYHCKLIKLGLTTNQNLKNIYAPISQIVPFTRCDPNHPKILNLDTQLIFKNGQTDQTRSKINKSTIQDGKRFSTITSQRQSVRKYLVDEEL